MGDLIGLIAELKGPLGGGFAIVVALAVYMWSQRGQRAVDAANNTSNISAIEHWKAVADRSDKALEAATDRANKALEAMTLRADKFAEERNEAWRAVAKLEGQISEMQRQMDTQTLDMQTLRQRFDALQERFNEAK